MRPLDGVHVLDLATFIAAPFAATILAEFGAEVQPRFKHKMSAKETAKQAELAPHIKAALARKTYMRPLEDHEIPLVKASVKQVQGAGIN